MMSLEKVDRHDAPSWLRVRCFLTNRARESMNEAYLWLNQFPTCVQADRRSGRKEIASHIFASLPVQVVTGTPNQTQHMVANVLESTKLKR